MRKRSSSVRTLYSEIPPNAQDNSRNPRRIRLSLGQVAEIEELSADLNDQGFELGEPISSGKCDYIWKDSMVS